MIRAARFRVRGFTLIEVLVVVAIIALLISILIPTLKQAKEQAARTVCAAHMHQVMFGMSSYGNDNKGDGPMRGWFTYTIAEPTREALGWGGSTKKILVNLGMLWPKYVGRQVDVLYCPKMPQNRKAWPEAFTPVGATYWVYGGYNYGAILARRGDPTNPGRSPNFRGTNPFPPEVWASGFTNWVNTTWKKQNPNSMFRIPASPCLVSDLWIGGFTPPHSNGKSVNVSYTDGHVRNHLIDKAITSGGVDQYKMWYLFSLKQ